MHPFPHTYNVVAETATDGDVTLSAEGLSSIPSQAPTEFGGPGNRWSPESLLTAAVADCFALGFRAIAGASKFPFVRLNVNVSGILDIVDRKMQFTEIHLTADLQVAEGSDVDRAQRLLQKAEESCLVTNSLNLEPTLHCTVKALDAGG